MKPTILFIITTLILSSAQAQSTELTPGSTIEKHLSKGDKQTFSITLTKGGYAELTVMQKGVDLALDLTDRRVKK